MSNNQVYKFGGGEHPFSNYYPASATYEGITYMNGEAAFQAAKMLDTSIRKTFSTLAPGVAKGKGRKLALRPDWEDVKYQVMIDILRSKFQDSTLKEQLLGTGNATIVENTTSWHDNVWGNCECEKCQNILGKNLLGKALMEIRAELRKEL